MPKVYKTGARNKIKALPKPIQPIKLIKPVEIPQPI
jgi:hypothetical protein